MTAGPDARPLPPIARLPLLVSALVLVGVAAAFMAGGNVAVFAAVQRVTVVLPDAFWAIVTICGAGVVAFAILSPVLLRQPRFYAAAVIAAALAGAYSGGMKRLYGLPRPAAVFEPSQLHVIGHVLKANTFPSGHTVTAFTLAAILVFASTRPWRTATWAVPLAVLVALSRIAVGAHWPADLAAGAAGGWISGACAVAIVERWRGWNVPVWIRCLGLVSIGIGLSLFIVDLGYPQAVVVQYAVAMLAIVVGGIATVRPRPDPLLPPIGSP